MEIKTDRFHEYYNLLDEINTQAHKMFVVLNVWEADDNSKKTEIENILKVYVPLNFKVNHTSQALWFELRSNLLNTLPIQRESYYKYLECYTNEIGWLLDMQESLIKKVCEPEKYLETDFIFNQYEKPKTPISDFEDFKGVYSSMFTFFKNSFVRLKEGIHGAFNEYLDTNTISKPLIDYTAATSFKKIKWSGTPGEFGAIFNQLFDNGFIEVVKDRANMVRVLNEIFDIKNEKFSAVDEKYLYKCFGEKERNYFPDQLKIPLSDNYHKKKPNLPLQNHSHSLGKE